MFIKHKGYVMRKHFLLFIYVLLAFKLIYTPVQASTDGDYREVAQMSSYEEEEDLSVFGLILIFGCVIGIARWLG